METITIRELVELTSKESKPLTFNLKKEKAFVRLLTK